MLNERVIINTATLTILKSII